MTTLNQAGLNRVVIMDYGGVLGLHYQDPAENKLSSILAVTREELRALITEQSPQGEAFREDRISEEEFWTTVFKIAGRDRSQGPSDAMLSRLWSQTYAIDKEVLSILSALRNFGPVGILTNIDRSRSTYLTEKVCILDYIDIYLPSYRFGAVKTKPFLWETAHAEIQLYFGKNASVLYIDDRQRHVDACAQVGWVGLKYYDVNLLKENLSTLGLLDQRALSKIDCGEQNEHPLS